MDLKDEQHVRGARFLRKNHGDIIIFWFRRHNKATFIHAAGIGGTFTHPADRFAEYVSEGFYVPIGMAKEYTKLIEAKKHEAAQSWLEQWRHKLYKATPMEEPQRQAVANVFGMMLTTLRWHEESRLINKQDPGQIIAAMRLVETLISECKAGITYERHIYLVRLINQQVTVISNGMGVN